MIMSLKINLRFLEENIANIITDSKEKYRYTPMSKTLMLDVLDKIKVWGLLLLLIIK